MANLLGNLTQESLTESAFRRCEFDILYGEGISRTGEIIDKGVDFDIIKKSGSWFKYGDMSLGQGRDTVRALLKENTELCEEIAEKVAAAIKAQMENN